MSKRDDILAAVAAKLVTASVASGRIYRSRREQLGTLPAVIVEPDSETAEELVLGVTDAELRVAVRIFAEGDAPDSAADATLAAAHAALMADLSLGLADVQLSPRREIDWQFENFDHAQVTARYLIQYRTAFGSM
jgi:hypothetical protein